MRKRLEAGGAARGGQGREACGRQVSRMVSQDSRHCCTCSTFASPLECGQNGEYDRCHSCDCVTLYCKEKCTSNEGPSSADFEFIKTELQGGPDLIR